MMTDKQTLLLALNGFYRSWHSFEIKQKGDMGSVLDFDYCPAEEAGELPQFDNRLDILEHLERLQSDLGSARQEEFSNHEFLVHKLRGANTYIRALLGERFSFEDYCEATLGARPATVGDQELAGLRELAVEGLAGIGVEWGSEHTERYDAALRYPDTSGFGDSLRRCAAIWVNRVLTRLELPTAPQYRIETVSLDEYWHNWIDGKLGEDILLRINTHPRITFRQGQDDSLSAHEIAGHGVHIMSLDQARAAGEIESTLMNTTVHSCEMFQMEGLAQGVIHLISQKGELSPMTALCETLNQFHQAVRNRAQLEVEDGHPIDSAVKRALAAAPFLKPLSLLSDLRDRSRSVTFRAYVHVYYPSLKEFLRMKDCPAPARHAFLRKMYTQFWTPRQISEIIHELTGSQAA